MTLENFIPSIWSARLLQNMNEAHVFASLANRDYEGEITQVGDTVKINAIGRVTVGTYTKNTNISAAERYLGYKPVIDFETGLRKTVDWYKSLSLV